jgi:hypothetical protein
MSQHACEFEVLLIEYAENRYTHAIDRKHYNLYFVLNLMF